MLLLITTLLASAQDDSTADAADNADAPEDFSDVVLVWPDKFARWQDTRWLVATELVLPTGLGLVARENLGVQTYAFQARATVSCDQDYKLGPKKIEVTCKIEDFALRASTMRRQGVKQRDKVQAVLDEIDADMTGASVQLQVNARGSITNIDLEGVTARNVQERRRLETLRQIAARLFYPFHMKLPKSGVKEGNWPEFDSELMSMPSLDGITGFSTIVHWMNFYKGYLLVQDIGNGVVTVNAPLDSYDDPSSGGSEDTSASGGKETPGGLGQGDGGSAPASRFDEDLELDEPTSVPSSYRLRMTGVSIYNIDNGIMEERVWSMIGYPTASNLSNLKYWYAGRIQLLGSADQPDLGTTEQISYPGNPVEGLPIWLPVDPELEKDIQEKMKAGGGPREAESP